MLVVIKALLIGFLSFLISLYITPLLIKVAVKFSIVDKPDGKLKRHEHATPYLGGLAIYFGFLVSSSLVMPFASGFGLFIISATILLFVGLLDDLIVLTPAQKFGGQFFAALCYMRVGFYLKCLFFTNICNIGLAFVWLLGLINAFNLIDVMDGLATTVALAVSCSYLMFAIFFGDVHLILLLVALIGSLVGFLWFNKPSARIYLGDAGSLFLGGLLACIPFAVSWSEYNPYGYLVPIFICVIPLLECGTLILVRTYKRIPFYRGSPDHFSIFLQQKGWSKWSILCLTFACTIFFACLAFFFFINQLSFITLVSAALLFLTWWYFNLVPA